MLRAIGSYIGLASGTDIASNPQLLNIATTKFDPQHAAHINFIDERLQNFISKRDALTSYDQKVAYALAADTFIWWSGFTGSWGPYLAVVGYFAIIFSAKQHHRDSLKREFDGALDELYSIYHWYTKDQGAAVTHQPRFQELLSAMIPFTLDWQKLVVWDLKHLGQNDISPRVAEIFEKSPHKSIAPVLKLDARPAVIVAPTAPILGLPNPKLWVNQNNQYQFFAETAANAKLKLLYGHSFEKEAQEAPQPRKG